MKLISSSRLILFGYAALVIFLITSISVFKNNDIELEADYQNLLFSQSKAFHIQQMQIHAQNRSILLSQVLLEPDVFIQDKLIQVFFVEGIRFGVQRNSLFAITLNEEDLDTLDKLNDLIVKNSVRQRQVIDLVLDEESSKSQSNYLKTLPYQAEILNKLSTLTEESRQQAVQAQRRYQAIVDKDEKLSGALNTSLLLSMILLGYFSYRQSKQIEKRLHQSFDSLNTQINQQLHVNAMDAHILRAVEESIALSNKKGKIIRCNPSFESNLKKLGTDSRESIWKVLSIISDAPIEPDTIIKHVQQHGVWRKEVSLSKPLSLFALIEITEFEPTDLINADLLLNIKDISELKEAQKAIETQANYDAVTDLPNRHFFQQTLSSLTKQPNGEFSLLYIDLDDFKNINDRLGHDYGDKLLSAVSFRMQNLLLELYADQFHLARIGGDEFAVILKAQTDNIKQSSISLAEQLVTIVSETYRIQEEHIEIGCSIGISLFPEQSGTSTQLMRNADLAMYEAKHNGKNRYVFFNESIKTKLEQRLVMQERIEAALQKQEFVLHYQPQINLQTKQVIGLEALIRWQSDEVCYRPDEFIPFAEENGLIQLIDEYVIKMAFKQIDTWLQQGIDVPRVAINISSKQSQPENLVTLIDNLLTQYGFDAKYLELEVTEYSLITDIENQGLQNSWLSILHNKGIHISIDDFGTGYSSLSYLQNLHVNRLKIDRSFINGMIDERESLLITESIIQLGHNVGAKVLAEGVETEAQSDLLLKLGCDEAQGYLYAAPLNEEKIRQLLQQASLPSHWYLEQEAILR